MSKTPSVPIENEWWTARRFLLVLMATVIAVFPKVALGLNTFFYRDYGALGYPGAFFLKESLRHGELPFWNPYSHCGVPFLAQMGQWYPPSWVCAFLPMPWSLNVFMLLHLVLGGTGLYLLARRWGAGEFAACVAGFAYAFNGVSLSCFQWGNYIASLGWLPWLVIVVSEAWRRGGRWIPLAALAGAMQVLTATPELTLMAWLFLGVLWLSEVAAKEIKITTSVGRLGGVILLAGGITMVQMLPFLDLLTHSQRDTNYEAGHWAMPGWGWANLLVPLFHAYRSPQGIWFQSGQEFFPSYYPGAGILALAVMGALWTRTRLCAVVAGSALFCWILALGNNGHLYSWLKQIFPLIGIARFPVKFTVLTSLLIPMLAAWAIGRIQSGSSQRLRRSLITTGIIALLLMGFLVWFAGQYPLPSDNWRATVENTVLRASLMIALLGGVLLLASLKKHWLRLALQFGLLGIILFDAFNHNPNIVPTLPASILAPGMWAASGKPSPPRLGAGRIMISPDAEQRLIYSQVSRMDYDFTGKRLAEWYNLNLLDLIPKVTGAITLRPAVFDRVERYLYYTPGSGFSGGFLDFVSVAWYSAPENPVQWTARTNFLPVITAGQRPVFADDDSAMNAITATNFNPRTVVYLPESERPLVTVTNQSVCSLASARFTDNSVEADATATTPCLVVLSQTFYHLWQAEVDGHPVSLLRANVAFQAVQIPAGTHHVKLTYRDRNFVFGGIISLLSIAICAAMWWHGQRALRRNQKNV